MREFQSEEKFTSEMGEALMQVFIAWREFKRNHDLKSKKLECCEKSRALFAALNDFEVLTIKSAYDGNVNDAIQSARPCNAHEEMLAALKACVEWMVHPRTSAPISKARAAIAKAEGMNE